jgi:hypothetical protein
VDIEPDIGSVGLLGTREVAPSITTNYTLTAKNKDQEKIASVRLIVKERNESNPVNSNAPSGIVAKSNVSMPKDVEAEQDQQQNATYATLPSAVETSNPDESAESSTINQTDAIATYSNESNPSANSGLGTSSGNNDATESKAAKRITAADWDYLKNVSSSETDFASNAPIYAKLDGMNHTPTNSPDFQDPAVSDLGIEGSDYLSAYVFS